MKNLIKIVFMVLVFSSVVSAHSVETACTAQTNTTGFNFYRSADNGATFVKVNAVPVSVCDYTDSTVTGGTKYLYAVSAVNANGESAKSATLPVTVPEAAPGGLSIQVTLNLTPDKK